MHHHLWKDHYPSFIPEVQYRQEGLWRKWSVNRVSCPNPVLAWLLIFLLFPNPEYIDLSHWHGKRKGYSFFFSLWCLWHHEFKLKRKKMESNQLSWNDSVDCNMECFWIIIFWKWFMIGHGSLTRIYLWLIIIPVRLIFFRTRKLREK